MRQDVIKALAALITAAFGLVAALAWNTAIQEIFKVAFGQQSGLLAMIIYAVVVTVIAVFATIMIGRVAAKAGMKEEKSAEIQESEALRSELRALREEMNRIRRASAA
jgi:multisubunit Na+/H+ antiporter MnhG subunit